MWKEILGPVVIDRKALFTLQDIQRPAIDTLPTELAPQVRFKQSIIYVVWRRERSAVLDLGIEKRISHASTGQALSLVEFSDQIRKCPLLALIRPPALRIPELLLRAITSLLAQ